ncbi:MAG: ribosome-associated translation inhibitor RaiA [Planctomycetes bacterium]|nr:ribosome-associated translation inhibitor RaiA [Planctomycetota bacterium]
MEIHVTARSEDVTKSMKDYANQKVQKLEKYFGQIHGIDIFLSRDHDGFVAEVKVAAGRGGRKLVGKEKKEDMIAAIDLVLDKMERQLTKLKEKVKKHKASGTAAVSASEVANAPEPSDEPGETYEDIIRGKEF